MAADAAALPVVGHQYHRGVLEPAALLEEGEKPAHSAVRLHQLVEVLGAAHAANVTELVGGQQLEDEQVWVLLLDHAAGLLAQRVVDPRGRLDRRDRPHGLLVERVQEVRDPHQPAAAVASGEHVEDRLDPHAEPRREVRAHPVLLGRRAGEHGREADDGARRVRRLHVEVLGALVGEAVDHRGVRLPEACAVAAINNDHVDPAGERPGGSGGRGVG